MAKKLTMTFKEKLERCEHLFDAIKMMFPDANAGLTLHSMDIDKLGKDWTVTHHSVPNGRGFRTAKKGDDFFGFTIFEKIQ